METIAAPGTSVPKDLVQRAIQANKDHQYALKVYTERLEAELKIVDKLLSSADVDEQDEGPDLDVGGSIYVRGAKRPVGLIPSSHLLKPDSPFYEEALKRSRYLSHTTIHPMKPKELEALAEAVKSENYRRHAFETQQRGHRGLNPSPIDLVNNTEGLDWDRIAEKVAESSGVPRTARECEIRWVGNRHPQVNHDEWTQEELERLRTLVSEQPDGSVNWSEVAKQLGTRRMPLDCMRRATHRATHIWGPDSDARLVQIVKVYGTDNWILVAKHVSEDATAAQCQARYFRTLDPTLRRGAWTAEEDSRLCLAVAAYGNSWMDIAAIIPGRNNEQCRDRWSDRINPKALKGKWTDEEDQKLMDAVNALGHKWKAVSERMANGRTDSHCRVRYEKLKKLYPSEITFTAPQTPEVVSQQSHAEMSSQPPGPGPRPQPRQRKPKPKPVPTSEAVDNEPTDQPAKRPRPKPKPRTKNKDTAQVADAGPSPHAIPDGTDGATAAQAADGNSKEAEVVHSPVAETGQDPLSLPTGRKRPTDGGETAPTKKRKSGRSQTEDSAEKANAEVAANEDLEEGQVDTNDSVANAADSQDEEQDAPSVAETSRAGTRQSTRPRRNARLGMQKPDGPVVIARSSPRKKNNADAITTAEELDTSETMVPNLVESNSTTDVASIPPKRGRGRPRKSVVEKLATAEVTSQATPASIQNSITTTVNETGTVDEATSKPKGRPRKTKSMRPVVTRKQPPRTRMASKNQNSSLPAETDEPGNDTTMDNTLVVDSTSGLVVAQQQEEESR